MERRQTGTIQVLIGFVVASFTISSGLVTALISNERRLTQNEIKIEQLILEVRDLKDTIKSTRR